MSWPLSSGIPWQQAYRNGHSLLLFMPWQADALLTFLSKRIHEARQKGLTLWCVLPPEQAAVWHGYAQYFQARGITVACLNEADSATTVYQLWRQWQNHKVPVMLMMASSLAHALHYGPVCDVLLAIAPGPHGHWFNHPSLHNVQKLALSPPLPLKQAQHLQRSLRINTRVCLPVSPFKTHIWLYKTPSQFFDALQQHNNRQALWLYGDELFSAAGADPMPAFKGLCVDIHQLPFALKSGTHLFIRELPPCFSTWLACCVQNEPLYIHVYPAKHTPAYWAKINRHCIWQATMQLWQGHNPKQKQHLPKIPVCGVCHLCTAPFKAS